MVHNKSTRWDCDVRLWRGIPSSIPSFHGWNNGDGSHPDPVKDARFYVCHHCNTYVPEQDVPGHPCWDPPTSPEVVNDVDICDMDSSPKEMTDEEFARYWVEEDKEEEVVVPKYVIATEENEKRSDGKCLLCKERLELKFDQDEEDWIYMGCIIVNQKLVHEECHNIVSG